MVRKLRGTREVPNQQSNNKATQMIEPCRATETLCGTTVPAASPCLSPRLSASKSPEVSISNAKFWNIPEWLIDTWVQEKKNKCSFCSQMTCTDGNFRAPVVRSRYSVEKRTIKLIKKMLETVWPPILALSNESTSISRGLSYRDLFFNFLTESHFHKAPSKALSHIGKPNHSFSEPSWQVIEGFYLPGSYF